LLKRFVDIVEEDGFRAALESTYVFLLRKTGVYDKYKKIKINSAINKLSRDTDNGIYINYDKMARNEIARLCDKYGTDKGTLSPDSNPYPWPSHNYSDFYELIFSSRKESVETLLECGIGTTNTDIANNMGENGSPGASLRVWRDYFPNAEIVGIDIDREVMFSEERIDTYCVDQTSKESIQRFLTDVEADEFDIIIDDGLHEYHANFTLFENTIDRLSEDGIYIIEDVHYGDLKKYREYFDGTSESYHVKFVDLENPKRTSREDDRLIMISPY